jgi:hypothetical protein
LLERHFQQYFSYIVYRSEKYILLSVLFLKLLIPGNLRNVIYIGDRRGRDRMVVGFTTTYDVIKKKLMERANLGHGNRAAVSRNRYGVEKTVDIHTILFYF